jgi:hypothetical protein
MTANDDTVEHTGTPHAATHDVDRAVALVPFSRDRFTLMIDFHFLVLLFPISFARSPRRGGTNLIGM